MINKNEPFEIKIRQYNQEVIFKFDNSDIDINEFADAIVNISTSIGFGYVNVLEQLILECKEKLKLIK